MCTYQGGSGASAFCNRDGGNMLFGLTPLFSHDIWLHAVTALASAYFGFVAAERVVAVDASRRA